MEQFQTKFCLNGKMYAFYITTSYMCVSAIEVGRVAQSVQRLTTGWTVRGSNPGGGARFSARPYRPWGPPSFLYNGYRIFPWGKVRPGRAADHSPPSSAEVLQEQSYTSTPLWATTGPLTGLLYFIAIECLRIMPDRACSMNIRLSKNTSSSYSLSDYSHY